MNSAAYFAQARKEVHLWLDPDELMWKQRSWIMWLKEGDNNLRFIHTKSLYRQQRNCLVKLKNEEGL